jgi:hypothetical protein
MPYLVNNWRELFIVILNGTITDVAIRDLDEMNNAGYKQEDKKIPAVIIASAIPY